MKKPILFFKPTLVLISLLIFSSCQSSKTETSIYRLEVNPHFTIVAASYQKWVAGTEVGGSGTDVYLELASLSKEIQIQDIFFSKQTVKAQKRSETSEYYVGNFRNGVVMREYIMDEDPIKEAQNTPPPAFPFQLKHNECVLSYSLNGTLKYFKIENMEEKPMIAYPAARKQDEN